MWVRSDAKGEHAAIAPYQDALRHAKERPNWIFARKIRPFTAPSRIDIGLILEHLGLEVPLPSATKSVTVLHAWKQPITRDRGVNPNPPA